MRSKNFEVLSFCGLIALGLAACRQRAPEAPAAEATPAAAAGAGTTTQTVTTTTTTVTADPVLANQHNAMRRRERPAPGRTGQTNTGYSEERRSEAGRGHEVPAGTILRVAFNKTISTATAHTGDTVSGELLDDLLSDDGTVVAAAGSRVSGKIDQVVDSGKLARPAALSFRLTELTPKGGPAVPITTSVYQRSGETHTKRNTEYIAGGAAVGAVIGQIFGRDTKATLEGAAAGAAAGTGVAAATGDLDFEIEAGRTVAFTLQQPLRLPAAR